MTENSVEAQKYRVLIADDEEELRELLAFSLSSEFDVDIIEAADGREAIEHLQGDRSLDLIFCDYNMPNVNGGEVFQFLQDNKLNTPFVLVSSEDPKSHKVFQGRPLDGYVEKPFFDSNLTDLAKEILGSATDEVVVGENTHYVSIALDILNGIPQLDYDLFVQLSDKKFLKVARAGEDFGAADVEKYREKGITHLFFNKSDADQFLVKFKRDVFSLLHVKNISIEETYDVSSKALAEMSTLSDALGWPKAVQELAEKNIQVALNHIAKNESLNSLLERLRADPDHYLASHSAMLVFVATGLAHELGWDSDLTTYKLAMAAYLHDSALNEQQLRGIHDLTQMALNPQMVGISDVDKFRNHPIAAVEQVSKWDELPTDIDLMISQHHERPDGMGFPYQMARQAIAPLSALFIVAEDLVDLIFEHGPHKGVEKFVHDRSETYSAGEFKKVFHALAISFARKKF